MTPSLTTLRSLAEAATPGPWTTENPFDEHFTAIAAPDVPEQGSPNIIASCIYDEADAEDATEAIRNAAFIAACSPDVILALIGELEQLRAQAAG